MLEAFLISLREVVEAILVIVVILGVLKKTNHTHNRKAVWIAVLCAICASTLLFGVASIWGLHVQERYAQCEAHINGTFMIISALFITWAVFFLHTFFSETKGHFMKKAYYSVKYQGFWGLFILAFTTILRESIEIVLFLAATFVSVRPVPVLFGITFGIIGGVGISIVLYKAIFRFSLAIFYNINNVILIGFGGYMIFGGLHELMEVRAIPRIGIFYTLPLAYLVYMFRYVKPFQILKRG